MTRQPRRQQQQSEITASARPQNHSGRFWVPFLLGFSLLLHFLLFIRPPVAVAVNRPAQDPLPLSTEVPATEAPPSAVPVTTEEETDEQPITAEEPAAATVTSDLALWLDLKKGSGERSDDPFTAGDVIRLSGGFSGQLLVNVDNAAPNERPTEIEKSPPLDLVLPLPLWLTDVTIIATPTGAAEGPLNLTKSQIVTGPAGNRSLHIVLEPSIIPTPTQAITATVGQPLTDKVGQTITQTEPFQFQFQFELTAELGSNTPTGEQMLTLYLLNGTTDQLTCWGEPGHGYDRFDIDGDQDLAEHFCKLEQPLKTVNRTPLALTRTIINGPQSAPQPGGYLTARLELLNTGSKPITALKLVEPLPVGQSGTGGATLLNGIDIPAGLALQLSETGCLPAEQRCANLTRSHSIESAESEESDRWRPARLGQAFDLANVRALQFEGVLDTPLQPGEAVVIDYRLSLASVTTTTQALSWPESGTIFTDSAGWTTEVPLPALTWRMPSPSPAPESLGGFVWVDGNGDGLQQPDEAGLNGVEIALWRLGDPAADEADRLVAQTVSHAQPISGTESIINGGYRFYDLPSGNYQLRFDLPANYQPVQADLGADDRIDSDAHPATGVTDPIAIVAGESSAVRYGLGLTRLPVSTIEGYLTVQSEAGPNPQPALNGRLNGYRVELRDGNDNLIKETLTGPGPQGGGGYFSFPLITPAAGIRSSGTATAPLWAVRRIKTRPISAICCAPTGLRSRPAQRSGRMPPWPICRRHSIREMPPTFMGRPGTRSMQSRPSASLIIQTTT